MKLILIVEDDAQNRELLRRGLQKHGYEAVGVEDAPAARAALAVHDVSLILLDIRLPGESGTDFLRSIQPDYDVPVIFLTGLATDTDIVVGLELGADDYIAKPFNIREVIARIGAVLRRAETRTPIPKEQAHLLTHGRVEVDMESLEVRIGQEFVDLTNREFSILSVLIRRPRKVFTREELRLLAYPPNTYVSDKTINTHVNNMSNKCEALGCKPVEAVRGVGYRMARLG